MTRVEWTILWSLMDKHGWKGPTVDLGGLKDCTFASYDPADGVPGLYRTASGDPWEGLNAAVSHDAEAFSTAEGNPGKFGTVLSTSTLEHVSDPTGFFAACGRLLSAGGLLALSTPFRWYVHGDPKLDFWRFTDWGLRNLADRAGLRVLDAGIVEMDPARAVAFIAAEKPPGGARLAAPGRPEALLYKAYS